MAQTRPFGTANSALQFVAVGVLAVVGIAGGWIVLATDKALGSDVAAQLLAIQGKRDFWQEKRPNSFRYVVQLRCFCGSDLTRPYLVMEQDGRRSAEYLDAPAISGLPIGPSQPVWLDDLFAIARTAVQDGQSSVTMSFDEELGFPDMINLNPGGVDGGRRYLVSNFETIE